MSSDDLPILCKEINSWALHLQHHLPDGHKVFASLYHDGYEDLLLYGLCEPCGPYIHLSGAILNIGAVHFFLSPGAFNIRLFTRHLLPEERMLIGFVSPSPSQEKE